jgi:hypothetical protein
MPKFHHKTVKAAAALMSGLALVAPAAAPVGAVAPHAPAAHYLEASPSSSVPRLDAALLSPRDLPAGYAPTVSGYSSTVAGLSTDTNICDHRISSHGQGPAAQATFIRGLPGPMLFETLSATGPRTARAIVAGIAHAPRLCSSFNSGQPGSAMKLRLAPLRVPRLGDASSGIRFSVRPSAFGMTIDGRLIAVARRGVSVTIVQINSSPRDQREFYAIAATAIRKLDRAL